MTRRYPRHLLTLIAALALAVALPKSFMGEDHSSEGQTVTPIKHIVVLFQENISFDHYFGTYPYATNPEGEPEFHAAKDTPRANNLLSGGLLDQNPNSTQPFRLDRTQAWTCDQNHDYTPEQQAFNHGLMDKFPQYTGTGGTDYSVECDYGHAAGLVMGYYDGNTVTAWWNCAQHYALSDNFYGTMFGPSTVGALNLAAGTTSNATLVNGSAAGTMAGGASSGVVIGDSIPAMTIAPASSKSHVTITGTNIGDLLNNAHITWGWFQGGFAPTTAWNGTTRAACIPFRRGFPPPPLLITFPITILSSILRRQQTRITCRRPAPSARRTRPTINTISACCSPPLWMAVCPPSLS